MAAVTQPCTITATQPLPARLGLAGRCNRGLWTAHHNKITSCHQSSHDYARTRPQPGWVASISLRGGPSSDFSSARTLDRDVRWVSSAGARVTRLGQAQRHTQAQLTVRVVMVPVFVRPGD